MSLRDDIMRDTKEAMKARDRSRVEALRMLTAALKNGEIEKGAPLTESEEQTVLRRQLKQRKESAEAGAASMRDMRAVMGRATALAGDRTDGKRLSALVRERLQG